MAKPKPPSADYMYFTVPDNALCQLIRVTCLVFAFSVSVWSLTESSSGKKLLNMLFVYEFDEAIKVRTSVI